MTPDCIGSSVSCDEHLACALRLAGELYRLSGEVRLECEHRDCLALDAALRDASREIRRAVESAWHALLQERAPGALPLPPIDPTNTEERP